MMVYVKIELGAYTRLYDKAAAWQDDEWDEILYLIPCPLEICPACGYTMDIRDGRMIDYYWETSDSCPGCGHQTNDPPFPE